VIGYYPDIEQALMRLLEERIGESDSVDAKELIQEIWAAKLEIVAAVKVCG